MLRTIESITSSGRLLLVAIAAVLAACSDTTEVRRVSAVHVSPASHTLIVGETAALTARAVDDAGAPIDGRDVAWSTTDASVATVTSAGVVRAISPGSAVVRAGVENKAGEAVIVVTPAPVARVRVDPAALALTAGDVRTLVAVALDVSGSELPGRSATWTSSNASVAEVDANGRVVAHQPGEAIVTATVEGRSADAAVTVSRVPVAAIAVTPTAIVLDVGKSRQLTAIVTDAAGNRLTDRVVEWTTDYPTVAVVSGSGLVAAQAPGYATITARAEGKTFSLAVTVSNGELDPMPYDLVYHRTYAGAVGEIMILGTAEGSRPVRVNAGNVSRQPSPSPDGNRIAFYVSQRECTGEQTDDIFAVDRDGLNMKRLTSELGYDGEPAWSPNGGRIAYRHVDGTTGQSSLWVMDADGSHKRQLTNLFNEEHDLTHPAWSPDGSQIAFASTASGATGYVSAIWVMNADGSNARRLTTLQGQMHTPAWSPFLPPAK